MMLLIVLYPRCDSTLKAYSVTLDRPFVAFQDLRDVNRKQIYRVYVCVRPHVKDTNVKFPRLTANSDRVSLVSELERELAPPPHRPRFDLRWGVHLRNRENQLIRAYYDDNGTARDDASSHRYTRLNDRPGDRNSIIALTRNEPRFAQLLRARDYRARCVKHNQREREGGTLQEKNETSHASVIRLGVVIYKQNKDNST